MISMPCMSMPKLVEICERILKEEPHHPTALHYYIHVTEASRNPATALKSADVLKQVMPNVAHMVHMSSRLYERTGIYAKCVHVNENADQSMILYDFILSEKILFQNKYPLLSAYDIRDIMIRTYSKKGDNMPSILEQIRKRHQQRSQEKTNKGPS